MLDTFVLLFVCTGNICRSPVAEGIMKDLILDEIDSHGQNLPIKVMSAGTHADNGNYASENAVIVAARYGIDINFHRSRYLTAEIVNAADLLLTMEKIHTNIIKQNWPHINAVYELKSFGYENPGNEFDTEIYDPIGMGLDVYIDVFNDLKKEIDRVSHKIFSLAGEKFHKQ